MAIDNVPTTPEEEVLLLIGDEDEELITADVITYILSENDDNVNLAAVAAIRYIISSLAKRIDEEVGDVKVKFSQLLDNYRKLLDDFLTNPAFSPFTVGLHKFGGVSKAKAAAVRQDPDSRGPALTEGFFTKDSEDCSFNRNDLFSLECD